MTQNKRFKMIHEILEKGKKIEFTKKLEIYAPTDEELNEWDKTHSKEFISRMRHPPADEVGGNTGVLRR